jgi:tetratricopeptide (TPR) repeat protein
MLSQADAASEGGMLAVPSSRPMPAAPAAPAARSPWFHSAAFDLLLILAVPFLTWPLVMAGQRAWGAALLNQLIVLSATGHYFATFVRAYGDRELFARFQVRFLVAPVLLLVVCLWAFTGNDGRYAAALLLVTAGWAFWHWLAQAFGFARIYDIKVGSFRPLTAWLDKALVIAGFLGAVTWNASSTAIFGKLFLDVGIPLPSAPTFAVVQWVVLVAIVLVAVAYLGNLGVTLARAEPWSWQKQFMHATTIGYYWFAFAYLPNVLVAYVLYELFHDIQYYAITWLTCRHRVQRPGVTSWLSLLFRPGFVAAVCFVLVMTALGGIDFWGRSLPEGRPLRQVSLALFLTAALLHYYYDGFIWKARESALGKDLGIQGGLRAVMVPGLRHAARWSLFFVPLIALLVLGRDKIEGRPRAEALVAVAPGDFASQQELGFALMQSREIPAAMEHYRASIAANPDFALSRLNYGAALDLTGDLDGARAQYELALQCPDSCDSHRAAHVNLGVLLLARGERALAQQHLQEGARMGGEQPVGRLLGLAAAVPAEAADRRMKLYAAALELDPNQLDARFNLANLMLAQGQPQGAVAHYAALVQARPDVVAGYVGLATAQSQLGQREQALATLQGALQREPGNAQALALRNQLANR